MVIRIILVVILSTSTLSNISQASEPDTLLKKSETEQAVFRELIIGTIITMSFFGGYSFLIGTSFGGDEISSRDNPKKATAKWAGATLIGMSFGVYAAESLVKPYHKIQKSDPRNGEIDRWKIYRAIFSGTSATSIINFQSESIFEGDNGLPQWTANTPEVKTTMTFPVMGYRLGAHGTRFGGEFETSIVSHHTNKQTISYDANGEIYVSDLGIYVPLQIDQVEIPDRFLMLHSLSLGANFYTWLPDIGVNPYVGFGGRLLLNSVQSLFPGPAELIQQKGGLALDSITLGWGFNAIFGLHIPISEMKFLFAEFRPIRYSFNYESGLDQLQAHDRFTLQSFEFQIGLGIYY